MIDHTTSFRALAKFSSNNISSPSALRVNQQRHSKSPSPNFHLYSWHANQILADITQLRDLILDKRKEYILCSNAFSIYGAQRFMSDADRKKFDRETDIAIKNCTKLIKDLNVRINSDKSLRAGDEYKHLTSVINLLNVYLKEVLAIVAQLREIHLRKARQIRKICRLANLVDMYGPKLEDAQKEEEEKDANLAKMRLELEKNERFYKNKKRRQQHIENKENLPKNIPAKIGKSFSKDGWEDVELELDNEITTKTERNDGWSDADLEMDDFPEQGSIERAGPNKKVPVKNEYKDEEERTAAYEPTNKDEQVQLIEENKKILGRFTATDSELHLIESKVAEIQRLQNMFSEKICEQEQNIDLIHSRTVYTLDNLQQANDYIREAIKNQANRRVITIFCLLVLTFTLLFLDWYNP
uniref:t-SNARE coiled-coil homology domain-containing protein n=1 Tax=Meloidogyne hapla TaxID=6305 RepID=A0A1I8BRR5_MELHA